jgi:hypothetical protein
MSVLSDEILRSVAATAAKLRVVQASFADETPERRGEFLEDALHQAVQQIMPDQRAGFLGALKKEFPSGFKAAAAVPAAAAAVPKAETAEELADKLIRASAGLHDDERKALILRLQKGGLTVQQSDKRGDDQRSMPGSSGRGGVAGAPDKAQQAFQYMMKKLEIADLDITRLVKLMLWLIEYAGVNDGVVWNTWRVVAPKSGVRRPADLRKEMIAYIGGDKSLSGSRVEYALETQRRLLAALIGATSKLGTALANGPLRKFRLEEIKALASQEGGGLLASLDARCWSRYQQMAADLDEEALEHAVKEALSTFTEKLLGPMSMG